MKVYPIVLWLLFASSAASAHCVNLAAFGTHAGQVVETPAVTFLNIITIQKSQDEGYSIAQYGDLPKGGIDGTDLCGLFEIRHFGPAIPDPPEVGDVLVARSLLLKSGVDYEAAYPEAFPIAQRREQFLYFDRQNTWIGVLPEGLEAAKQNEIATTWATQHSSCARSTLIKAGRTVLIPTC